MPTSPNGRWQRSCLWYSYCLIIVASLVHIEAQQNHSELEVTLVKIGGSSITHKAIHEQYNATAVTWFIDSIANLIDESFVAPTHHRQCTADPQRASCDANSPKRRAFVVIHGAGSFGHFEAKKYGLSSKPSPNTISTSRQQMHGFADTRRSVTKLNHHIVTQFIQRGNMNAVGVTPCSSSSLANDLQSTIVWYLKNGMIPILHGDVCFQDSSPIIVSGDTLMEQLSVAWQSTSLRNIVFLTDVDGVYDKDPNQYDDAELLRHVGATYSGVDASGSQHAHDVTGGLELKLKSARTIVRESHTNVTIVRCGTHSAQQALGGRQDVDVGTVIYSEATV